MTVVYIAQCVLCMGGDTMEFSDRDMRATWVANHEKEPGPHAITRWEEARGNLEAPI